MKCLTASIRRVAFCGLLFTLLPYCHADPVTNKTASDELLMFYFRFDKAEIDMEYMNNSRTLCYLDELFANQQFCARIDSINIISFASPDGNSFYNERLAGLRALSVKEFLVCKYPYLNPTFLHSCPRGENWIELRRFIVADTDFPDKEEVLQIIDCNDDLVKRKALLKKLNGGTSYRYIHNKMLRYLRNAAICIVRIKTDSLPALPDIVGLNPDSLKLLHHLPQLDAERVSEAKSVNSAILSEKTNRYLFALKTNLLYDATLMPNVELEVPIGKRWSVNGEYMFPWWLLKNDRYCLQILAGGLEGRYWIKNPMSRNWQEVLTGHFLGLYAGGGKYDLQWEEKGYQGEFYIAAGVSYGWATRIARNLHLEFNVGIGLLRTHYRHYSAQNNYQTLLWKENGNYTWFGPTKAKISLVWLLGFKSKKGDRK